MKIKTRYCKICKEWFSAANAARHCQRKHPWLPVAWVGLPGRPENCNAVCESQAPLGETAAADRWAVSGAGVALSPVSRVETQPVDGIEIPMETRNVISYVGGYLVRKARLNCSGCKTTLLKEAPYQSVQNPSIQSLKHTKS